jgi:hypothetical protein
MLTIVFGVLSIVLGMAGFVMTGMEHFTALIPAGFGVIFVILGGVATQPTARKHAMHGAAMLALIGFLGTFMSWIKLIRWASGTEPERPAAVVAQAIMAALMVVFLVLCVRSFIQARRARQLGDPANPGFPVTPSSSTRA